jgi:hypothetical protein
LLRRLRTPAFQLAVAAFLAVPLAIPSLSFANHALLVEGEGDFDGDGRIGSAEDADAPDGIFGKISTALAAANGGLNQNGKIIIVTSGRFPEVVSITGPVTLEAAPGVEADIEAFLSPAADPARLADFDTPMMNNASRQLAPGIVVNAPLDRPVVIRNITTRNWTDGIRVVAGNVTIDNVRVEHNVNNGIAVLPGAQVAVYRSSINATGFRLNPASGDFPRTSSPAPGIGVRFTGNATGDIQASSITGSFGSGISIEVTSVRDVFLRDIQMFGNNFGNASAFNLSKLCRMATNRNLDEAEVCFQAVQRQLLGIPEPPQ